MKIGICKFCNEAKLLINAHIIPESLYPIDDKGSRMQFILDSKGEPRKKSPTGIYDPNLVCKECEKFFDVGDAYAKELLIDRRSEIKKKITPKGMAYYEYIDVDYKKLKLFFISLLWRAHATSRPEFNAVMLGAKYELLAKQMIKNFDPGSPKVFSVFVVRIEGGMQAAACLQRRVAPDNILVYEFFLFGYVVYIKVDARNYVSLPKLEEAVLAPGQPLIMLEKTGEETPIFPWIISMVQASQNKKR